MELDKELLANSKVKIEVIYAGGTISSLAVPAGYREGGHVVDLLGKLEEKQPGSTHRFDLGKPQVAYTGLSENVEEENLVTMEEAIDTALSRDPKSILMSFGTDFAEQAAKRFQKKYKDQLEKKGIKIVIVTANDDLSHPNTDAWGNLTFSLESAAGDAEPGVYLGFHNRLIPAELVVKEPYNGHEMNFRSKDDPEYIEAIQCHEQQVQDQVGKLEAELGKKFIDDGGVIEYPVNVFRVDHQDFLDHLGQNCKVRAVLLTLYHSGTANTNDTPSSVSNLVSSLRERGIVFFGVTENGEPVDLHSYESSVKLREAGVVPLYDMQREVALVKLRLLGTKDPRSLIDNMIKAIAGEISEDRIIKEDIEKIKEGYAQV